MSEKVPYYEPVPEEIEVRRDELLLRISELREDVKRTSLNQEMVSAELEELSNQIQMIQGLDDMTFAEQSIDFYEKIVDSRKNK